MKLAKTSVRLHIAGLFVLALISPASAGEVANDCIDVTSQGSSAYFSNRCNMPVSVSYCEVGNCNGARYYTNLIGVSANGRTFIANRPIRVHFAACIGANPLSDSNGTFNCR